MWLRVQLGLNSVLTFSLSLCCSCISRSRVCWWITFNRYVWCWRRCLNLWGPNRWGKYEVITANDRAENRRWRVMEVTVSCVAIFSELSPRQRFYAFFFHRLPNDATLLHKVLWWYYGIFKWMIYIYIYI